MAIATKSRSTSINFSTLPHLRTHGSIYGIMASEQYKNLSIYVPDTTLMILFGH